MRTPCFPLLGHWHPSAIFGLVISVAVDAIDGQTGSVGRTHVAIESLETGIPVVADLDAATAVDPVVLSFRIAAALTDIDPGRINSLFRHGVCAFDGTKQPAATALHAAAR